jgi:hypothetical protein
MVSGLTKNHFDSGIFVCILLATLDLGQIEGAEDIRTRPLQSAGSHKEDAPAIVSERVNNEMTRDDEEGPVRETPRRGCRRAPKGMRFVFPFRGSTHTDRVSSFSDYFYRPDRKTDTCFVCHKTANCSKQQNLVATGGSRDEDTHEKINCDTLSV